jgi:hypothetical protein
MTWGRRRRSRARRGTGGELTVAGSRQWTDTGMDVEAGDLPALHGDGRAALERPGGAAGGDYAGVDGYDQGVSGDGRQAGALVGRVGEGETNRPFLDWPAGGAAGGGEGAAVFGANQAATDGADGAFPCGWSGWRGRRRRRGCRRRS